MTRQGMTSVRLVAVVLTLLVALSASVAFAATERVSVGPAGVQGNLGSWNPAVSADGRYIAFYSVASNLVTGDTNTYDDVFVRDRTSGVTERVSVSSAGAEGNAISGGDWIEPLRPAISADGRYVAFQSFASNLVAGDGNKAPDVFVHDRTTGATTRVSVSSAGAQADGGSLYPSISANGRRVAFWSTATNLVPGDAGGYADVFVHDLDTGATTRASVTSAGAQGNGWSHYPVISADGTHIAFQSSASNLVAGDTNTEDDIFVHDTATGDTIRVSVSSLGAQADIGREDPYPPAISADGRYIAFALDATNLVAGDTNTATDIFVRDCVANTTTRASVGAGGAQATGASYAPAISDDGKRVAFRSWAANLVAGDTNTSWDIFVRDREAGTTTRVSVDSAGVQATDSSHAPAISANGVIVGFTSAASNLVAGDTNSARDVFVRNLTYGTHLSARASATKPVYGSRTKIVGVLRRGSSRGAGISGEAVWLQKLSSRRWVNVRSLTTGRSGVVTFTVSPTYKRSYRLRYSGVSGEYGASTSPAVTIKPKVYLGKPVAPDEMRYFRVYRVYGALKPRHGEGSQPVRIYKWRQVSGEWKSYGYVKATAYDYKSYSHYDVRMRLRWRGSWKLRAYAPADARHSATWSARSEYVTVE